MSNIKITDSDGRVRPAIIVNCLHCKTDFSTYRAPSKQAKYCSPRCAQLAKIKLVEIKCAYCKKSFQRHPSDLNHSKSGFRFCSKKCKGMAQRIGGIPEIMPSHYGTASEKYRNLFTIEELKCYRCGYDEFPCAVEIHHKDEDRSNNKKENLIPLCACCHRALHNKLWTLGD